MVRRIALLLLLSCSLVVIGCGGVNHSGNPTPTPVSAGSAIPAADHVFVVVLENHSALQVSSSSMPFLNSLATQHSQAANYFANTHPSIGNYFMLTTGNIETNDDSFPGTVSSDNIAQAVNGAGKTWKAYMESLPSVGYTGGDVYPYVKHHNPFAFMTYVLGTAFQGRQSGPLLYALSRHGCWNTSQLCIHRA